MDPFTAAAVGLSAYVLFRPGKVGSKGPIFSKFIPKPQPNFKSRLNEITNDLETKLEIKGLNDIFMGIAYIESKYIPSAIRYESNGYNLVMPLCSGDKPNCKREIRKKFSGNKWAKTPALWNFTGGLFQMFPGTALSVDNDVAINFNPTTVFDPYTTICYAIDFASRLNKYYNADSWFDIRLGWHSLSLLSKKTPSVVKEVEGRIVKGIKASNGNVSRLYDYNPYNFEKYRSDFGFIGIMNYINKYREGIKNV